MKTTIAKTEITEEKLFDLIAPIHIYHNADLMWKKQAIVAFNKLKKIKKMPLVAEYFGDDIAALQERTVDKPDYHIFWAIYNKLFKKLVVDQIPQLYATYDQYGAQCFKIENSNKLYLSGDSYDCFPFYGDWVSLKKRIEELKNEL